MIRYFFTVLIISLVVLSCGKNNRPRNIDRNPAADPEILTGKNLYTKNCTGCHLRPEEFEMPVKSKLRARNFVREGFLYGSDVKSIKSIILNGVPKSTMPGHRFELKEKEAEAIAKYLMHLRRKYVYIFKPANQG